ncbi:MAG TPA: hypothetical protein VNR62_04830, partial [Cellulomonas sp.]|nr:hypothetical protein [Cellulomonas sp.]
MRLTLSSPSAELPDVGALDALDVDADVGATIGRLRPHLARLTGVRDWVHAPVSVAGRALDDAHAVGHAPLVTGAVLCLGPGTPDPAVEAVGAPWHVAVVRGPAAGSLVGVRSQATVGTLRVRVRQGRVPWRRQAHVQVRRRWRWRRWRPGHVLDDGPDRYELRTAASARGEQVPTHAEPHREPVTAWVASLVGAAALAAVTRQPVFLAAALAGPLVMLVSRVVRRRHVAAGEIRDVAAVVARSAAGAGSEPARLAVAWGPDGTLAVVGPRVAALAHARGVVVGTVGSHADVRVVVRPADSPDWRWTRWATDDDAL